MVQNLVSELSALREHFDLSERLRLKRRPRLNLSLLSSDEVKSALHDLFLGKCAYCETEVSTLNTDVHHHRPLMNARDSRKKKFVSADHYAWYAYEWNNLLLACVQCSRFKTTQFPTANDRVQPFTPWSESDQEKPFLLDPCADNMFEHLSFKRSGRCLDKSPRGKNTISVLKLNRSDLVKRRSYFFSAILDVLERFRGAEYQDCLETIEKTFDSANSYVGSARIWISDGLAAASGNTSPVREGEFTTELAGFMSLADDKNWMRFSKALIGREEYLKGAAIHEIREVRVQKDYLARAISVSIENFKGIESLILDFGSTSSREKGIAPSAALLGENSTGKSSIMQALAIGVMSPKLREQLNVNFERLIKNKSQNSSPGQNVAESSDEVESVIKVRFDNNQENSVRILRDGSIESEDFVSGLVLAYGASRSFDKEELGTGYFRRSSSINSLFERNRLIPHSLHWLETIDEEEFPPVARALREILNLKHGEEIYRSESGEVYIFSESGKISLTQLSDGYRSLFAMSLDIIRNMIREWGNLEDSRGLVLIDEIETHLHPRWKMQVVGALRSAMPQVQFIFTTHDPLCLRGMLNGEVHVLVKDEYGLVNEMTGLPDISGMRAEQLLTSEYFGLASTVDPLVERNLDEMILSGFRSKENIEQFEQQLDGFTLIGDTPERQIINQALRLHIVEELRSKRVDRSEIRKEAVELILERLRVSAPEGDK